MDFEEINKQLKEQNEAFKKKLENELTEEQRTEMAEQLNEIITAKHQNKECFCEESHKLFEITSGLRYSDSWPKYLAVHRESKCWSCCNEYDSDFERKLQIETSGDWKP